MRGLLIVALETLPAKLGKGDWIDADGCICGAEHLHRVVEENGRCQCTYSRDLTPEQAVDEHVTCIARGYDIDKRSVLRLIDHNDHASNLERVEVVRSILKRWGRRDQIVAAA